MDTELCRAPQFSTRIIRLDLRLLIDHLSSIDNKIGWCQLQLCIMKIKNLLSFYFNTAGIVYRMIISLQNQIYMH